MRHPYEHERMKVAFLILVHKLPHQLRILIEMSKHEQIDFFIHLDQNTDYAPFRFLARQPHVYLIKNRVSCKWGTYSLVQATINGLREIRAKGEYGYINFISGQDLPLVSGSGFMRFLETHQGKEFMSCKPYNPEDAWWQKNERRFLRYNFQNWNIPGKYRLQFLFNRIMPERKIPMNLTISGESQWFCISNQLAGYMLDFLDAHPDYVRYFKYVWGADEFIFSTIAFNSPFRNNLCGNLHFINWDGPSDGHPKTLGEKDFDDIINSGKLFARKFDLDTDPEVIQMLRTFLQKQS